MKRSIRTFREIPLNQSYPRLFSDIRLKENKAFKLMMEENKRK